MTTRTSNRSAQAGFTLVELMVSVTLGLLVSAAVGSAFVQSSRSTAEDERYQRMIENGRYALSLVIGDLKMTSFWGELLDPAGIATALEPGVDCGIDLFDAGNAVLINSPNGDPAITQFDSAAEDCVALMGTVRANAMQLAVKRTSGIALDAAQIDGVVYLRSNGTSGSFIDDAQSTPPPSGYRDWAYTPTVYYIREEAGLPPRLCRLQLSGTAFAALTAQECVADGIEQIHVQFGLDTDEDGIANLYKSNPAAAEMGTAVTARVWVLARSVTDDPAYTNQKTYQLGDLLVAAADDHRYRRVFCSTIELRNPANLASLR